MGKVIGFTTPVPGSINEENGDAPFAGNNNILGTRQKRKTNEGFQRISPDVSLAG